MAQDAPQNAPNVEALNGSGGCKSLTFVSSGLTPPDTPNQEWC